MKINLNKNTLKEVENNENQCIDCKKCYKICPMMEEYTSSPKSMMKTIIREESVNNEIPYSCTLCGECKIKCPKNIDLKRMFCNIRKEAFDNKNKIKPNGYNIIKFHQNNSFSPLFSTNKLNINTKRAFLPGCSLTSYSSTLVENIFNYLKDNLEDISLLIKCCGKPTETMGDMDKFKKYYSKLEKIIEENNIEEVIVACPNCLNTIRKYSKNLKVTPIWDIISEYGVPKELINHYKGLDISFTLHDPCPIRNESNIHDEVREILNTLGITIEEFKNNRKNTKCCGSGGMVRVTNYNLSKLQTNKRAMEAKTDSIISYCQSCCEAMLIADKKTLHVLDFIFNKEVIEKNKFTQDTKSTLYKWKERYKGARFSKKEVRR